ncbi:MAG: DMT family transporter [Alphaproteobacteria bacterium]
MTRLLQLPAAPALSGAMLMVGAGIVFAAVNILVQLATMTYGIGAPRVAFWQYLVALVFYLPWLRSKLAESFRTSQLWLHGLRVVFAAAGVQLWVMGLATVPIWQAIALVMLSPFFVTVGAGLALRETVTPQRWLAVIAGFAGGAVILAPWSDAFTPAVFYPIGAAALWAFSSLTAKHMTRTETPETLTVYLLLLLTPVNAAVAAADGFAVPLDAVALVIAAAGALTAAAQYLLVKAYSVADAAYLQPFDHVKLPLNVLLGLAVFGFVPPGSMWLGSLLIVGASFFLLYDERRAELRGAVP